MSSNPDRPPHAPVEYERPQGIAFARTLRLLLLVTLVNTILLGINLAGMKPWDLARQAYKEWSASRAQAQATKQRQQQIAAAQQQCMEHTFDAGHVVYTEVPDEAMLLFAEGKPYDRVLNSNAPPGWQTPAIARAPDCLIQFDRLRPRQGTSSPLRGALFLHQRTTPTGRAALVNVSLSASHEVRAEGVFTEPDGRALRMHRVHKSRTLTALAFAPAGSNDGEVPELLHRYALELILPDAESTTMLELSRRGDAGQRGAAETLPVDVSPGHRLRVLAGQSDPADLAHFTIPYGIDGTPGVIDGWLRDDAILLRPRAGRLLPSSGTPRWELNP